MLDLRAVRNGDRGREEDLDDEAVGVRIRIAVGLLDGGLQVGEGPVGPLAEQTRLADRGDVRLLLLLKILKRFSPRIFLSCILSENYD